jgi:hypothetical protein
MTRRKTATEIKRARPEDPVLTMPKQTTDAIERRNRIREEHHDLRAKTIRGKRG